ncbi:hypothetical protein [Mycolicibacterium poriferae]|uniref:hypothetical protein n=1 Tax=Mycolicibacterium poriferae TaxID=39694 RepID=UPI0024B91BF2|nr:hypothetical protein [Mycolicibacterium poriferae]
MSVADTLPNIPLPPGAERGFGDAWGSTGSGTPDRRVVLGDTHAITGSDVTVSTSCIQHIDGHIDDGSTDEAPTIYLDGSPVELTPDQARELAALLLKLALQIEGWVAK